MAISTTHRVLPQIQKRQASHSLHREDGYVIKRKRLSFSAKRESSSSASARALPSKLFELPHHIWALGIFPFLAGTPKSKKDSMDFLTRPCGVVKLQSCSKQFKAYLSGCIKFFVRGYFSYWLIAEQSQKMNLPSTFAAANQVNRLVMSLINKIIENDSCNRDMLSQIVESGVFNEGFFIELVNVAIDADNVSVLEEINALDEEILSLKDSSSGNNFVHRAANRYSRDKKVLKWFIGQENLTRLFREKNGQHLTAAQMIRYKEDDCIPPTYELLFLMGLNPAFQTLTQCSPLKLYSPQRRTYNSPATCTKASHCKEPATLHSTPNCDVLSS